METCSICLEDMTNTNLLTTFSCNHSFHYNCFKQMLFKTDQCFLMDCPNCRQLNHRVEYPFKDDFHKNLKAICSQAVGKHRCPKICKTGNKCKKKSHILNYGLCTFHHKGILPKDKYEVMTRYIYHLLMCPIKTWETKVYLMDVVKKLLIQYPQEMMTLDDVFKYLFVFIADAKKKDITNCFKDKLIIYNYYSLELPDPLWVDFCVEKKCLF